MTRQLRLNDITVEVTNRCHLRCRRCDIWREKDLHEIPLKDLLSTWDRLFRSFSVNYVSVTGGEPFLHPEISGILRHLAVFKATRKIIAFGVYTNGACFEKIAKVLKENHPYLGGMGLGISVDGSQKMHDYLRGRHAYERTRKTLDLLRRDHRGLFKVEIKFTGSEVNSGELFEVYALAREYGFRFTPKLAEQNVAAYYHRAGPAAAVPPAGGGHDHVSLFRSQLMLVLKREAHKPSKLVDVKMLRLLLRLAEGGVEAIRKCETPARTLFITSRGDVHPCLYMPPAGTIADGQFCSRAFLTARNARIKKGARAACPGCFAYHGFLKDFNAEHLA